MLALAALLPFVGPVLGAVIAPPTRPEDGCPSARQVKEAMQLRIPEALAGAGSGARADLLRASIDPSADGTVIHFALVDGRGDTRLRRALRVPARTSRRNTECQALADTIAAIVERFLQGIEYDIPPEPPTPPPPSPSPSPSSSSSSSSSPPAPPPPAPPDTAAREPPAPPPPPPAPPEPRAPPPPAAVPPDRDDRMAPAPEGTVPAAASSPRPLSLSAGGGWRVATTGEPGFEGRLTVAWEFATGAGRPAAFVTAGAAGAVRGQWDWGTGTLRRFPLAVGLLYGVPAPGGLLELSLAAAVDLLWISFAADRGARGEDGFLRVGSGVETAVAYRMPLGATFFVRPAVRAGLAVVRYDVVPQGTSETAFQTARAYMILALEAGVVFR